MKSTLILFVFVVFIGALPIKAQKKYLNLSKDEILMGGYEATSDDVIIILTADWDNITIASSKGNQTGALKKGTMIAVNTSSGAWRAIECGNFGINPAVFPGFERFKKNVVKATVVEVSAERVEEEKEKVEEKKTDEREIKKENAKSTIQKKKSSNNSQKSNSTLLEKVIYGSMTAVIATGAVVLIYKMVASLKKGGASGSGDSGGGPVGNPPN